MLRPFRRSAGLRHVLARSAPSQTAAASSNVMPDGLCASTPASRTHTYSPFPPPPDAGPRGPARPAAPRQLHAEDLPLRSAETGEDPREERMGSAQAAVAPGDCRGVDLDEDLVLLRDGPPDLLEAQDLRRPVSVVDNSSHVFTSSRRLVRCDESARRGPPPPPPPQAP